VSRDVDAFVLTAGGVGLVLAVLAVPVLRVLAPVIDTAMVWLGGVFVAIAAVSVIVWVCNPKRG